MISVSSYASIKIYTFANSQRIHKCETHHIHFIAKELFYKKVLWENVKNYLQTQCAPKSIMDSREWKYIICKAIKKGNERKWIVVPQKRFWECKKL